MLIQLLVQYAPLHTTILQREGFCPHQLASLHPEESGVQVVSLSMWHRPSSLPQLFRFRGSVSITISNRILDGLRRYPGRRVFPLDRSQTLLFPRVSRKYLPVSVTGSNLPRALSVLTKVHILTRSEMRTTHSLPPPRLSGPLYRRARRARAD